MSTITATKCHHCGISFVPRKTDEHFCCAGCHFVHDMIEGEGFSNFYKLLGRQSLNPLNDQPITPPSLEWLESAASGKNELVLNVGNLTCTACVWLIEKLFRKHPGALRIAVDVPRATLTIWWDPGTFNPVEFATELHRFGYPVSEKKLTDEDLEAITHSESRLLLTRLGVTFGLAMNTMAFTLPSYLGIEFSDSLAGLFRLVSFASATLAMAVGGSYFFQRAGTALRAGILHLDIPISIGLIVAFLGSLGGLLAGIESLMYFDFVATFTTLMLAGRWLHIRLIEKNRRDLRAREQQIVRIKKRDKDGNFAIVQPKDISPGDEIQISEGSLIPVKGNLLSPDSANVSMDWINGEPEPVSLTTGQEVSAGSRNTSSGPLRIRVLSKFKGSLIEKLLESIPSAGAQSGSSSRVLAVYLYAVLITAIGGAAAWFFKTGDPVLTIQVLISILVVSCPCALGLALPLVDEILNSRMRQHGVFVRSGALWKKLLHVDKLIFDKTGTLTELVPQLLNPDTLNEISPEKCRILTLLVNHSHHPHSAALRASLIQTRGASFIDNAIDVTVEDIPGSGLSLELHGIEYRLGKASWASPTARKNSDTLFTENGEAIASFEFGESIRKGAEAELQALHADGFQTEILSGDPDRSRVLKIGKQLGIPATHIYSSYSPSQKATHIEEGDAAKTLFVGDGGNDGLALEKASCAGSPATGIGAIESKADFVFVGRSFQAIRRLFSAAKHRRRIVLTVFIVAVLYNIGAIGLCLAGMMNPLLAAVLMPLSSIVTTTIATRA